MSESLTEIRKLIGEMYQLAGLTATTAHEYYDDCDLEREAHSMFQYSGFVKLSKGMIGQDSGQPWFLFWITNGIEVCNYNQIEMTPDIKTRCC